MECACLEVWIVCVDRTNYENSNKNLSQGNIDLFSGRNTHKIQLTQSNDLFLPFNFHCIWITYYCLLSTVIQSLLI